MILPFLDAHNTDQVVAHEKAIAENGGRTITSRALRSVNGRGARDHDNRRFRTAGGESEETVWIRSPGPFCEVLLSCFNSYRLSMTRQEKL